MSKGSGGKGLLVLSVSFLFNFNLCPCLAQPSASTYMSISATVIHGIAITEATGLSFGTLTVGTGNHSIAPTQPNVGSFTISGQSGANVSVTFPNSVPMSDGSGHTIAFAPAAPIWNTANSQTLGYQTFPTVTGGTVSFGSTGELYVWFGGSVNTNGIPVGSYSGSYTINITY